nr:unnamed protein product [Callosobruchus chinensis]
MNLFLPGFLSSGAHIKAGKTPCAIICPSTNAS